MGQSTELLHSERATPPDIRERFDFRDFIAKHGGTVSKCGDRTVIYAQGDPTDALFYIVNGTVKATFVSEFGKQAIISVLTTDEFFGEGFLADRSSRIATVVTTSASEIARLDCAVVIRSLAEDPAFNRFFMRYILKRNEQLKENLIDQLCYSSEKRLARILLTLAVAELSPEWKSIPARVNQEALASMVGTTRSRINQFMNKFRKLGYVYYDDEIKVHSSLLNVVLHDQMQDHGM